MSPGAVKRVTRCISQVLNAFASQIRRTLERTYREAGYWPEGVLRLSPCTWAEGTAVRAHETFSVDVGDYCKSLEPSTISINEHNEKCFPDSSRPRCEPILANKSSRVLADPGSILLNDCWMVQRSPHEGGLSNPPGPNMATDAESVAFEFRFAPMEY
ncbi:hypothetical protein DFH08DRAFT_1036523 [Mycena albidolilacea]|uniref:Uncharacterized protein n=1 Tax=Mycena albidolilacea TaxID=1033008 RepID=A0AAD7EG18_9AGAR|nr:hypothetical protein DFH08DRAFT_1036523 [Mycena albidolilacea]